MHSNGHENSAQKQNTKIVVVGAAIGMVTLVLLLVWAIIQAANEASALGWILAGIITAWLGIAAYLLGNVNRTLAAQRRAYEQHAVARAEYESNVHTEKLAHSFQICLVQSKVIAEQLEANNDDSRDMIDRALDTINFTAKNGMELAREGA
ncbi:hypothetical protein [Rothia nasisuis]|uniref:hypothetical protein n=1 Tax=Rothia nasisuis TaxID=2109647 RepID=UPI001F2327AB|nr:hypothetical protein [Rothia nasisuis]